MLFVPRVHHSWGSPDATFYVSAAQAPRLATAYKLDKGALAPTDIELLRGHLPTDTGHYPAPNMGLFCTAGDYVRFCQMMLNRGTFNGRQYLTQDTVRQMTTIQTGSLVTGFTDGNGWGLGCCVIGEPQGVTGMLSPGTFGHGGAYGTQAWIDPVEGRIYLLMVQRSNFPNSDASDLRRVFQQAAVNALK